MDLHPTPFPGKSRVSNVKTIKNAIPENEKEVQVPKQKRVFGTSRSTNVLPVKTATEKPIKKHNNGVSRQGLPDTAKPRVVKRQPVLAKLVETEKRTNGIVSSPEVKVNVVETEELSNGVVYSPTNKSQAGENTDGIVSSPAIKIKLDDTEEPDYGIVSSPVIKAELTEADDSTDGVVSSPAIKAKLGEAKELTNGDLSSHGVKVKLAEAEEATTNGVKVKSVETKEVTSEITSSPAVKVVEKKISGQSKTKLKKNVCFQEPVVGAKAGQEEMRTPVSSSSLIRPKQLSGTPYLSAEKCSKCRQHGLESSSYWITQIRLAESVEKHVVSAAFFQLALECNAEPIRTIRIELRRYLAKYSSLSKEMEWKNISCSYGLLKGESSISSSRLSCALEKAAHTSETRTTDGLGEEQKNVKDGYCRKETVDGDDNC